MFFFSTLTEKPNSVAPVYFGNFAFAAPFRALTELSGLRETLKKCLNAI